MLGIDNRCPISHDRYPISVFRYPIIVIRYSTYDIRCPIFDIGYPRAGEKKVGKRSGPGSAGGPGGERGRGGGRGERSARNGGKEKGEGEGGGRKGYIDYSTAKKINKRGACSLGRMTTRRKKNSIRMPMTTATTSAEPNVQSEKIINLVDYKQTCCPSKKKLGIFSAFIF